MASAGLDPTARRADRRLRVVVVRVQGLGRVPRAARGGPAGRPRGDVERDLGARHPARGRAAGRGTVRARLRRRRDPRGPCRSPTGSAPRSSATWSSDRGSIPTGRYDEVPPGEVVDDDPTHAGPARARRGTARGVPAPRAPRRGGRRHVVRAGHRRRAQQPHVPGRRGPAARSWSAGRRSATCRPPRTTWPASTGSSPRCSGSARAGAAGGRPRRRPVDAGTGGVFYVMDLVDGIVLARPVAERDVHRRRAARREPRAGRRCWPSCTRSTPPSVGPRRPGPGRRLPRPPAARVADAARRRRARGRSRASTTCRNASPSACPTTRAQQHRARRLPARQRARRRRRSPRITAILDWEMATLGDPAVDLGMLGLYWHIRDDRRAAAASRPARSTRPPATPSSTSWSTPTARACGSSVPELGWYRAFAAYKLAVILEGIHFRFLAGDTVGEGFDRIGALVDAARRRRPRAAGGGGR